MNPIKILQDISRTIKDIIEIKAQAIAGDYYDNLNVWDSKFGGLPYIPKNIEYPTNKKGQPLYLLAQLNLDDVPRNSLLPKIGLLQFYIDTDDYNGRNYYDCNDKSGFKILYIPYPGNFDHQSDLSFVKDFMEQEARQDFLPIIKAHKLTFYNSHQAMPSYHPIFEKTYAQYLDLKNDDEDFYSSYSDLMERDAGDADYQIGGYANCFYSWPSTIEGQEDDYELLLKIHDRRSNYSPDREISFGNGGVVNFIIHKNDLKNLDFSKVFYFM